MHRILLFTLFVVSPISFCKAELEFIESDKPSAFSDAVIINGEPLVQTGQIFPEVNSEQKNSVSTQFDLLLKKVKQVLGESDSSFNEIAKLNFYVTDDHVAQYIREQWSHKQPASKPAVCFVTTPLPVNNALMAVDVLAKTSGQINPNRATRENVKSDSVTDSTNKTPLSTVNYASERMVYISGQAKKGTLTEATTKTLQSLHDSLKWMKLDSSHVVQIKLFMKPMSDSSAVYKTIKEFYKNLGDKTLPAISLVEWESGLPVEIEMVAVYPEEYEFLGMTSAQYLTVPGMVASSVYCRVAVTHSRKLVYISGLYSKESLAGKGEQELQNLYSRLQQVLNRVNSSFDYLIKATYYVSDPVTSSAYTPVRMELYNYMRPPAASKAAVKAVGSAGHTTTIDMIAIGKN
jgi:enamine deaminase RidA (YjgF/YER057c/UK114 family)